MRGDRETNHESDLTVASANMIPLLLPLTRLPKPAQRVLVSITFFCILSLVILQTSLRNLLPSRTVISEVYQYTWDDSIFNKECRIDRSHLDNLDLTPTIQYARRDIHVYPTNYSMADLDTIDTPLFPGLETFHRTDPAVLNLTRCAAPLRLPMPIIHEATNASKMVFGTATTIGRLEDSLSHFQHWLVRSGARLVVLVEPHPNINRVQDKMRRAGYDVVIESHKLDYIPRYFHLTERMWENRTPASKWFVYMDDDTFFPSLNDVMERLNQYDMSEPQYVGGLSEDFLQVKDFGYYAFGGAGVFLNDVLMKELQASYPECRLQPVDQGDLWLKLCIFHHTHAKFTVEWDLHQMDCKYTTLR
jgi:hypothetical protein